MRMVGNGDAAHKKDSWNNEVSYGYWHKFNITDEELLIVERFSIIGMHQPIYNDKFTDQSTVYSKSGNLILTFIDILEKIRIDYCKSIRK